MMTFENILLIAATVLILSILASKAAVRLGVPALLLFLLVGMLAGSDGPGGLYFDDPFLAQSIGVIALIFILFSGGLDTDWYTIRPVLAQGVALATLGVLITALSVGAFVRVVFGFSWAEGILLGAIISSTDAAAVFSVLRGQRVNLKGRLKPLLELESGSNDPMAVFLTLGMITLITTPDASPLLLLPRFVLQMGIGAILGLGLGFVTLLALNRLRLEYDGLYPVLTTAFVLLTYGLTSALGGNGFLAVYLAGLVLAQHKFIHKHSLLAFHDGVAWLMQIAMFLTLGLQVYPSELPDVAGMGVATALFLLLAARPLSILLALSFTTLRFREKVFIAWVGLRGAAPIILATFPLLAGLDRADTLFNLVFFIVLTSVLLQGTLIIPVARLLGVYDANRAPPSPLASVIRDGIISNNLIEFTIPWDSTAVGRQILDLELPPDALVVLIGRRDDLIIPRGSTVLEAGDRLLLLAQEGQLLPLRQKLCS